MQTVSVRIPSDIPPSLHSLIELFYLDALRVRCVSDETVNAEIIYIIRFFRQLGLPDCCDALFRSISPKVIGGFLAQYAANNSPGSVRWMQVSLRSFLRFAYRSSLIERDLAVLVSVQSIRRLRTVLRSLPDECIARLRCGIDRSTAEGMRDSAIISNATGKTAHPRATSGSPPSKASCTSLFVKIPNPCCKTNVSKPSEPKRPTTSRHQA
jgi:site-specific recombinase XerD